MDKLACMQAFVAVVDSQGFSSAARKRGISKALISKYVGQLEEALGLRLLHRTTRRVSTTTLGQAYYERCKPLLAELQELEHSLQSTNRAPTGELRLNAPTSFAELHLMPVVAEYTSRYPEVRVRLNLTDRFVDLVEEGIDLAIRIADLADSSLVARKLGSVSMLVCASPDYLRRAGEPQTPADLTHHRCVLDANYSDADRWYIGAAGQGVSVDIDGPIRVNSATAVRELLIAGQGIGLVPSFVVADDVVAGRLQMLLPEYTPERRGVYAVYTHRKHLSAKVRLFIELLKDRLDLSLKDVLPAN